jgi:hypothetical protein
VFRWGFSYVSVQTHQPIISTRRSAKPVAKVWECRTDDGDFVLHWWIVDVDAYELDPDPGEVAETRWVTAEEFLELRPSRRATRPFRFTATAGGPSRAVERAARAK